ncbi:cytochrome c peroxidase [Commensalibacter intestini A911]|uniref:Cytochrome c peroxidase n=1 Tax=Commensalibacter intestini A911 TaxID=1088868 RepID=G6F0W6_9PROT|nr:cytochrome-c peroxidase [Commensalibacter intestini]EHD13760.1 cytochrome c peroxidase [Commensalibacter intestini A911]
MKKLILAIIVLGLVAYGATIFYINGFDHKTAPALAENSPSRQDATTMAAFDVLKEARCDYCHAEKVNLPFYFKLPVASSLMAKDREKGLRNFRMEPIIEAINEGKPVGLVALSRIEFVMQRNLMPPSLYLLMHWHARLSQQQRDDVIKWVQQERKKYYATQGVADRFASEAVQPVPESVTVDPKLVALGKKLFFEKRLSGDNTLSCASCHDLQKGGVDGLVTATGIYGQKGPINVPTVYNSVFNHSQFWDGRAADLEAQAAGPVMNPLEMGSKNWEDVANKLRQEPSYEKDFTEAFGNPTIDQKTITDAIAAYEKTLITPDSPFDMYLKGVDGAINAQEKRGYQLFKENGCASCHNGVALGGAAYEELGLQRDYFTDRGGKVTEADMGRYNVTHQELDKHSFKVPLLRNIALTGPYFHDGSVKTLKEAVEKMLKYQTPYHTLSDQEVNDIVAFLKTLTGKYQGQSIDKLAP